MFIDNKLFSTLLAVCAIGIVPAVASAQGVDERQHQQRDRIQDGYRNGELTRRETANLARQQARIRARERKNRHDGGRYTAAERARTQRALNNANRDIYRKKHNQRDRD